MTIAEVSHRERLLLALTAALSESEYHDVTIADIVAHARTSKRTFYEHFASKQDCFMSLVRQTNEIRRQAIVAAVDRQAVWQVQVLQAIQALFRAIHDEPATFLHSMRALRSLGEEGHALVQEDMAAFVDVLRSLADSPELRAAGISPPSREAAVVLVGGLRELIALTLEEGRDPADVVEAATAVAINVLGPHG